jgi:hypothetical protein
MQHGSVDSWQQSRILEEFKLQLKNCVACGGALATVYRFGIFSAAHWFGAYAPPSLGDCVVCLFLDNPLHSVCSNHAFGPMESSIWSFTPPSRGADMLVDILWMDINQMIIILWMDLSK